ncbi:hypothetical protein L6452_32179 [Arctium lappa]|uniref:Uncharacterized protein n=1 Tax=Arctium lappa TaxID=4217 RepID=A0ACB8Z843_ARCLA|nr:hypothetical protein L6452_32179 [Arctium lappa]
MDTRDVQIITSHGYCYRLNIPSIFVSPARTKSLEKMEATKSPEKMEATKLPEKMDQIDGHGRSWKPPNRWKKRVKKPSATMDVDAAGGHHHLRSTFPCQWEIRHGRFERILWPSSSMLSVVRLEELGF